MWLCECATLYECGAALCKCGSTLCECDAAFYECGSALCECAAACVGVVLRCAVIWRLLCGRGVCVSVVLR